MLVTIERNHLEHQNTSYSQFGLFNENPSLQFKVLELIFTSFSEVGIPSIYSTNQYHAA